MRSTVKDDKNGKKPDEEARLGKEEPAKNEENKETSVKSEEKAQLSKATLLTLLTDVTNVKETPDSYSLAVRIELIFSLHLLQKLFLDAQDDLDEVARQLMTFLKARLDALRDSAAWNAYSRHSKINIACVLTAKRFLLFYPGNLTVKSVIKYDEDCMQEESDILAGQIAPGKPIVGDEEIYKFIYRSIFAKQPIQNALNLLPKEMKDVGSVKDSWLILLSNIIPKVPNRLTFIKIIAHQVEQQDWRHFFKCLTNHGQLFSLMLEVNINQLVEMHKAQPLDKQTDANFETTLYAAADAVLRASNDGWTRWDGTEGTTFKTDIIAKHGCESQIEVLALGYALFETYRRVRAKQNVYTSAWAKATAAVSDTADKEVKIAGCDILMAFCLQADRFTRDGLNNYIVEKTRDGTLNSAKEKEFKKAIEKGVLCVLLDAMFEISAKVHAAPAPGKR